MNEEFKTVIRSSQADVQRGLALFRQHRGLDDMRAWREHGLSRHGYLDTAEQHYYFFHGIRCELQLSPEIYIDWDFGHVVDGWTALTIGGSSSSLKNGQIFSECCRSKSFGLPSISLCEKTALFHVGEHRTTASITSPMTCNWAETFRDETSLEGVGLMRFSGSRRR